MLPGDVISLKQNFHAVNESRDPLQRHDPRGPLPFRRIHQYNTAVSSESVATSPFQLPRLVEPNPRWQTLARLIAAADELATCSDLDEMMHVAVDAARNLIGLERVGFFLRDPSAEGILMRGTWGTDDQGRTVNAQTMYYEATPAEYERLRSLPSMGHLYDYKPYVPQITERSRRPVVIGHGWLVATPLISGRELLGVMHNDAALSHNQVNDEQQAHAAAFCGMLAGLLRTRRPSLPRRNGGGGPGPVVLGVLDSLEREPQLSGQALASQLHVSAGHLARLFKREMGMSLVEYRNRLRLERFFHCAERGPGGLSLAAQQAGFGSYAQFRRVYRSLTGESPRDFLQRRGRPQ
jgi:AraC-like DNA-binding protein